MNINERIELIIKELGFNKNSFSKQIGLTSNTVLQNILGGRKNKPSYDVLSKILLTFDSIDANWLITGEGDMYKTTFNSTVNIEKANVNNALGHMSGGKFKGGDMNVTKPNNKLDEYEKLYYETFDELTKTKGELLKAKDRIIILQDKLLNNS